MDLDAIYGCIDISSSTNLELSRRKKQYQLLKLKYDKQHLCLVDLTIKLIQLQHQK
jgi:hypothetical protein